jgi:hypothetical protein
MLPTNHRQIKSIPGRLVTLTEMSPHVRNSMKAHKIRSKLREKDGSENSSSMSIIIHPLSVSSQIQPVGLKSGRILMGLLVIRSNIGWLHPFQPE